MLHFHPPNLIQSYVSILNNIQKNLKIPNESSEAVTQRRTDNTIAKRKSTKGQTTIYKALHRKQKIEQLKTRSEFGCSRKMSSIYSTSSRNLIHII
jgi:hypothetical protein